MTVSPATARDWLAYGTHKIDTRTVESYARTMRAAQWPAPGALGSIAAPITFHRGRLIDGHHRLAAVAYSGITLRLMVQGLTNGHYPL
jgi:hypothetical protein